MKKLAIAGVLFFSFCYSFAEAGIDRTLEYGEQFRDNASLGRISGVEVFNRFGEDSDLDTVDNEATIWNLGTRIDPMVAADTFNITYNNTTDGSGQTGAQVLYFYYIDENREAQEAAHTLGSDGSDTTTFSGLGVNRVIVVQSGSVNTNTNDITITETTSGQNQSYIPAGAGTTHQCFHHVPAGTKGLADWLFLQADKISGGNPKVDIKGYVHSFVSGYDIYRIFDVDIDTSGTEREQLTPTRPFVVTGPALLEFTADTDTNNTVVYCRFGIAIHDNLQ